eukprot:228832_1
MPFNFQLLVLFNLCFTFQLFCSSLVSGCIEFIINTMHTSCQGAFGCFQCIMYPISVSSHHVIDVAVLCQFVMIICCSPFAFPHPDHTCHPSDIEICIMRAIHCH